MAHRQGHFIDPSKFINLAHRLIEQGAEHYGGNVKHAFPQDGKHCTSPITTVFHSSLEKGPFGTVITDRAYYIEMEVPCRKCEVCIKKRSFLWQCRAEREIARIPEGRTWQGTWTCNAQSRMLFAIRAGVYLSPENGISEYKALWREISKEMTKMLKRIRMKGYPMRYMLVAEQHKDGFPHAHALIHETIRNIPKRILDSEWPYGFTNFKLKDKSAAEYVCKYVTKGLEVRVRASNQYGTI